MITGEPNTLGGRFRHFFDFLSPRILAVACAIVFRCALALGGWSVWDAVIVLGIAAFWPLRDWLIHGFILHYRRSGDSRPRSTFGPQSRRHHPHP